MEPNKAHYALAHLEAQGKLKAIVTQNIDGLHQLAGSKKVYELHGSVLRNFCTRCHTFYCMEYILKPERSNAKEHPGSQIPRCIKCGGVIKPDVVLYEEPLDQEVMEGAIDAISNADMLIVGGTSLVVYPAAGLINYFRGNNLVLINKSETPYDDRANLVIHGAIGGSIGLTNTIGQRQEELCYLHSWSMTEENSFAVSIKSGEGHFRRRSSSDAT